MFRICLLKKFKMDIHDFEDRYKANEFFKEHKGECPIVTQEDERKFKCYDAAFKWDTVPFECYQPEDQEYVNRLKRNARWDGKETPHVLQSVDRNLGVTEMFIEQEDEPTGGTLVFQILRDFHGNCMKATYVT